MPVAAWNERAPFLSVAQKSKKLLIRQVIIEHGAPLLLDQLTLGLRAKRR